LRIADIRAELHPTVTWKPGSLGGILHFAPLTTAVAGPLFQTLVADASDFYMRSRTL
jgi:hypothetical protein